MSGKVDLESWKHRKHYEYFRRFAMPFFSVTAEIDVTPLWRRSHEAGGPSLFLALLFTSLRAANAVEAFRLRLREDGVWRHDRVDVCTTVMRDDDTYTFIRIPFPESYSEFESHGLELVKQARGEDPLVQVADDDATLYHSSLPWIRFTGFSNALPLLGDSIPRLMFGKCSEACDRVMMPVGLEVHHAVVQGLDVGRFLEGFQAEVAALKV